jgi:pimeloyl-ACP methyl ester carboxylesterase
LLLVAGANDRMVPAQQARLLAQRARHAELVVLPGLGHLAHEENASAVVAAVLGAWRTEHRPTAPERSVSRHDPRADSQTIGV